MRNNHEFVNSALLGPGAFIAYGLTFLATAGYFITRLAKKYPDSSAMISANKGPLLYLGGVAVVGIVLLLAGILMSIASHRQSKNKDGA